MSEFANTVVDDVHEPVNVPDGTWVCRFISGKYREGKEDKFDSGLFTLQVLRPHDLGDGKTDVNEDELEMKGPVDDYAPVFHNITIFDRRKLWDIKSLAIKAGVSDAQMEGETMTEIAKMVKDHEIVALLQEEHQEGYDPRVNVKAFAPMND